MTIGVPLYRRRSSHFVVFCRIQGPFHGNLGPKIETLLTLVIKNPNWTRLPCSPSIG